MLTYRRKREEMTIAAGGPVVSGQRYTISDAAGHTPGYR